MSVVTCIVAHPDDEILGCGGTLARHTAKGDVVSVVIVADGTGARGNSVLAERYEMAKRASKIIKARQPSFLGYPDQRLDTRSLLEITQSLERMISDLMPDIIYTHHNGDLNKDHRIVHEAVMTAARPLPGRSIQAIYGFEVLSSTEWGSTPFLPTRFVDITNTLDRKILALDEYLYEMRDFPHPRSFEAVRSLAELRGSSVGLAVAEAFTVLREIER